MNSFSPAVNRPLSQKEPTKCDFCDKPLAPKTHTHGGTGYGWIGESKAACYSCCGWLDALDMAKAEIGDHAQSAFYYSPHNQTVSNWPGTLVMKVTSLGKSHRVRFCMGRQSYKHQVYFRGPNGTSWSGTLYHTPSAGDLLRNVRRIRG